MYWVSAATRQSQRARLLSEATAGSPGGWEREGLATRHVGTAHALHKSEWQTEQ